MIPFGKKKMICANKKYYKMRNKKTMITKLAGNSTHNKKRPFNN